METVFLWTDGVERTYARLQRRQGDWRAEWGVREPPASKRFLSVTGLQTNDRDLASRWLISIIRSISNEPVDVEALREKLRAALARDEPEHRQEIS